MINFSYQFQGFDELYKGLQELPDRMAKNVMRDAARKGALVVQEAVREKAPVGEIKHPEYGHLRDNITLTPQKGGSRDRFGYVVHNGKAFWAWFIEFGTRRMSAKPFMRPAFDGSRRAAFNAMVTATIEGFNKEATIIAGNTKRAIRAINGRRA